MKPIIEVNHLCKSFNRLNAVNNLSFTVNQGDIFGFLGENGAGKSTTIRMLLTLIQPTSGNIQLFGEPLQQNRKSILQRVGAVIEKPDLYKYLSAFENLNLFAKMSGLKLSTNTLMEQLDLVGLADRSNSKVKTFSQGMKQRLGIAVALVHNPPLIVLDEPTNGLDPQGIVDIRNLIIQLSKERGKTILVSSHLLSEIEIIANRLLIIHKGEKVVEGPVKILLDPAETIVKIETSDNYLADLDHRGNLGNVKILGSQTRTNQAKRTIYSGNVGFGIAHTLEDIAWTGSQLQSSCVVIKTGGNIPPTPMKVIVDGSERSQFLTGESTALFLAPYQTYKISINPVESSPIDYDGTVKQITLYPGNVMPLEWEMSSIHVVLGRVVTEDGKPVANAKIEESGNLVMTDEDGLFQTELKKVETITFYRAAQEHFAGKKHPKFSNGDSDMFTVMPPTRNSTSMLTDPEKRELILQLFGDVGDVSPPERPDEPHDTQAVAAETIRGIDVGTGTTTVDPVASSTTQLEVSAEVMPASPLRPAFRCRVELPEAKEVNNVIMYSEPLVCRPIPSDEPETKEDSATDSDTLEDAVLETPEDPIEKRAESTEETEQSVSESESLTEVFTERLILPSGGTKAIQLGAFRSESQARESWAEFEKLSPEFQGIEPRVEIADLPGSGRFYRLRIVGFVSDAETEAFCRTVKNYGRDCMIVSQAPSAIAKTRELPRREQVLSIPKLLNTEPNGTNTILPEPQ